MLATILGFLTGLSGPISLIVGKLADAKVALAAAETDEKRNELRAEVDALEARKAVLIAQSWSRIPMIMAALLAVGPTAYVLKYFLFDKVIGSFLGYSRTGSMFDTDAIGTDMMFVLTAVLGFYLLASRAQK